MNDDIIDRLAKKVRDEVLEGLEANRWPDKAQHREDHVWVQKERAQDDAFKTRRQRVIDHVIGGAGIVGLLAFVGFIGHMIVTTLGQWVRGL